MPARPALRKTLTRILTTTAAAAVLGAGACLAVLAAPGAAASSAVTCDKYASPSGSNASAGTASAPYATAQYLTDHLSNGQTGCLYGGSYVGNLMPANAGFTLASVPGQRAKLLGYVWIKSTANSVTLQDLDVDGHDVSNVTFQVSGDNVTLDNLDITNRNKPGTSYNGICLLAGAGFESNSSYTAYNLTVEGSRIHNCGDDAHEHAIYLESTRSAHIVDSYLYDNPGLGISLYPDAQGSLIEYDVIDGNSSMCKENVGFAGESAGGEYSVPHGSSNNVVRYSIVTNALCRYNVDSYYPTGSATPTGNVVEYSCVWNAPSGNFGGLTTDSGQPAYAQRNNLNVNPLYVDRAGKNFALQAASPCTGYGPRSSTAPATTTTTTTATTTTATTTTTTTPPPPDFRLGTSPTSASVSRGSQISFTTTITSLNGFGSPVDLGVRGLPAGSTGSFSIDPAASTSTLVITTSRSTPRGWYTLTVDGASGTLLRQTQISLRVRN
jgi:hypothetical protein